MSPGWPAGLRVRETCIACSASGHWLRARVLSLRGAVAEVSFAAGRAHDPRTPWLPPLSGDAEDVERVGPERVAVLPQQARATLPPIGRPVIVLWDERTFHPALLLRGTGQRSGICRYDEGDEEDVRAERILPTGLPAPESVVRATADGLALGTSVTLKGTMGWISAIGTGVVQVRVPGEAGGVWVATSEVRPGGDARPRLPRSAGEPIVGGRVLCRGSDRVFRPGHVRAERKGALEVVWDDGDSVWARPPRVIAIASDADHGASREPETRVPGPERWGAAPDRPVLVRKDDGNWARGTAASTRGSDAWVVLPGRARGIWARAKRLAVPADPRRMPAQKTPVIVEDTATPKSRARRYRTGRAERVLGAKLEVRLDSGARTTVALSAVYLRVGAPPPASRPSGVELRRSVRVERKPGSETEGIVEAIRESDGTARVRFRDGTTETVDLMRIRSASAPTDPGAASRSRSDVPSEGERVRELLRGVSELWRPDGGGYREETEAVRSPLPLDVEDGELTVAITEDGAVLAVTITASRPCRDALPLDGVVVRLARWIRSRLGDDPRERALDEAARRWAASLPLGRRAWGVARAGGALTLAIRGPTAPSAGEVVGWARAVHARLLEGDPPPR